MKVEVKYANDKVALDIPDRNIGEVICPWHDGSAGRDALAAALDKKTTRAFEQNISGLNLCVLLDDGTRGEPFEQMFRGVFPLLGGCRKLKFVICTGTHMADTPENAVIVERLRTVAADCGLKDYQVHTHDYRRDRLVPAGKTSRGTDVLYNSVVDGADVFLVLSEVKVHYFAGYSNPVKNFVPGICSFETTEQNHSLALDEKSTFGTHPWHLLPDRQENPLAADEVEGMEMIAKGRPVYALVIIAASGDVQWASFGPVQSACRQAFSAVDKANTRTTVPVPRLVVSPGGLPNDASLYTAQRALELTRNAVLDGGEILFLAACPEGIGEEQTMENFYNRLTAPLDQVLRSIEGGYKLYSHKPYKFAQMIIRLRRLWMYSQIPPELLEAAHLSPTARPQEIIDGWIAEDAGTKITVVDGANKIALYAG